MREVGDGVLGTAETKLSFQSMGIFLCCRDAFMMLQRGLDSSMANSRNSLMGRSLGVTDLFGLKALSFFINLQFVD